MNYYAGNFYLTLDEMKTNTDFIYNYLSPLGWTVNSIAGMLGNMQTESTINPAIWENLDMGNLANGFGLVQWTPATKYIDWCVSNNLDINAMESNLKRIEFEVANNIQWGKTDAYPFSFQEFKTSTETPEYLALAFLANYERPLNPDQPQRAKQARFWFNYLGGKDKRKGMPLWFYLRKN